MSRRVWPNAFMLYGCALIDALESGRAEAVVEKYFPSLSNHHFGFPIGLRWSTSPLLGIPRQPFNVYRRKRDISEVKVVTFPIQNAQITDFAIVEWGLEEMYEVFVVVVLPSSQIMIAEALDRRHEVIPGQRIEVGISSTIRFRSPGIAALRLTGSGVIQSAGGIDQFSLANAPDWQRIEVVGLPFENEVAPPIYNPLPQGIEPSFLSGVAAAALRLEIATLMQLPAPATGVPDIPSIPWPPPDATTYLNYLRGSRPSPFALIRECLRDTNDADPARMQVKYRHLESLDGIRQTDISNAQPGDDPTRMNLPVVVITILAVSSDSYAATGLGYGTIDFPPAGTIETVIDYMVTAEFVLPAFGRIELAALAQARPFVEPATNFTASTFQTNRAPVRDQPTTESVQLKWDLSSLPQGYGVAVSHSPGQVQVLNAPRPIAGGFNPFIPQRPASADGKPPLGAQTSFIDPVSAVPLSGTSTVRYLVIGLDVFGRWTSWQLASHLASAPPVTAPGLHSTAFVLNAAGAVGRVVPSNMEIEFSWDWSDYSPDRVEFTGAFFPAKAKSVPAASFTGGFALSAAATVGSAVVVSFDSTGNPSITSPHTGTIEVLSTPLPPGSNEEDPRKYRLTVNGLNCDFTASSELAYAVYAQGWEKVRSTKPSASAVMGPKVARIFDPLPPAVPTLPIDIRWTALPDAAGHARGVLEWPASPSAVGYVVWEATESALRHIIDPSLADPVPGTSLPVRAQALRNLITASDESQAWSLQAFSRLNTQLIKETSLELRLPGSADTIYAYRVSSVSASNVESERSSAIALFAVPRRNQPGQPRLLLRTVREGQAGVDVIALPSAGVVPAGYRVYRVRNKALLGDVGLMGPPKIEVDDPRWRDYQLASLHGATSEHGRAILDLVSESWYPYFYRLVAVGPENLSNGAYRGDSLPSMVQQAFLPPSADPLLDVSTAANTTNRIVLFVTDLPVHVTSLGTATIEIAQVTVDAVLKRAVRTRVLSIDASLVPEGPLLTLLETPTSDELTALPQISRTAPNVLGRAVYSVRVPATVEQGLIVVRDPLKRSVERAFPEVP